MRERISGFIPAKPRRDFIDFGMGDILALLQRLAIYVDRHIDLREQILAQCLLLL
jgi:hypothetical protein